MGWAQLIFFWLKELAQESARTETGMNAKLGELLEMTIPPMGYELVDWEMSRGRMVRVFIDKRGWRTAVPRINVDDCARVSNHLTHLFTVENIDYDRLEVSSPGLDRPLTKLADYARFAGEDVQLNLHEMTDGVRRVKGTLRGIVAGPRATTSSSKLNRHADVSLRGIDRCRLVPKIEWRKAKGTANCCCWWTPLRAKRTCPRKSSSSRSNPRWLRRRRSVSRRKIDARVSIDRETGDYDCVPALDRRARRGARGARAPDRDHRCRRTRPGPEARRRHRGAARADRVRPHRRAGREAGDPAEDPRRRARADPERLPRA